jgi:TRAP-type C4-dicarboxylate transport system permease large subunit
MFNAALVLVVSVSFLVIGSVLLKKLKIPMAALLLLSAVVGALVGGFGFPLRHFVEGSQLFLMLMLTVATGMLFMSVLKANGALNALTHLIVNLFHSSPTLLLVFLMLLIMLPAMLSGSAPASVLSTGALVAPILLKLKIPKIQTASIITMGSMLGMIAPPVNVPAMLIGTGVYMPYEGFALPLTILTAPLAVFSVLWLGRKFISVIDRNEILADIPLDPFIKRGWVIYLPLLFVIVFMIIKSYFPQIDPGTPMVFFLGTILALFTGKRVNLLHTAKESMTGAVEILALFAAVGMLIQVMAMTGSRGLLVVAALGLSGVLLSLSIAVAAPVIGGLLMPFGAAGVLGIPIVMAFAARDAIWVTSALTLLLGVGALLPPTAVSGLFAAQVVKVEKYTDILKNCALPAILSLAVGVAVLIFI